VKRLSIAEWLLVAVNTLGLIAYLFWLAINATGIFDAQEGILYVLPTLGFAFIYVALFVQTGDGR